MRGKAWFENNPATTARLSWEPGYADIAASGDLGYTTGPWEIRRTPSEAPSGCGHYVTVWRKQRDGKWKVAIDIGINHAASPKPARVESPRIDREVKKTSSEKELQSARIALPEAERRFPTAAPAYASAFTPDGRLYRNGSVPFVNLAAIRTALVQRNGTFTWKLADAAISGSADLAYAYGTAVFKPSDASKPLENYSYLRIRKRQRGGIRKVLVDLLN